MKRLTKSSNNVVLTGTLGGIAEYLGIDPTIVRVIYVFASFVLIGSPVLLYILMAVLIPRAPYSGSQQHYGQPKNFYHHGQSYQKPKENTRKQAEKIDDDNWSDF